MSSPASEAKSRLRRGVCTLGLVALVASAAACSSSGSGGGTSESTVTDPPFVPGATSTTSTADLPSSSVPSATSTTVPAGYAELAALLPTDVPSGLLLLPDRLADTGATDLAKAIQDDVTGNAGEVLRQAGFVRGYQRAWADAQDVAQNSIFVYQFATAAGASTYVVNRSSELEAVNSSSTAAVSRFPVLIAGAIGLRSENADSSFAAVVFSKGVYAVVAQATNAGNIEQSGNASALANAQSLRLP